MCLEILARLNARSHEIAQAVMHTSGQAYGMAFQAGGPHAQDRGLEAIAYAYAEMTRHPREATWEKPQGKRDPIRMVKRYTVAPRGIALVIGCNTFPTWNSYPGLFASLVTGNAVIVKPHPAACCRSPSLSQSPARCSPRPGSRLDLVCSPPRALDKIGQHSRRPARGAHHRLHRVVEYGRWLEDNARQAQVYTEKSGVNVVVVDSTDDYRGMLSNIAFSLSLYSGQMCTTPQNILVPRTAWWRTGHRSASNSSPVTSPMLSPIARRRPPALLGGIVNDEVTHRCCTVVRRRRPRVTQHPASRVPRCGRSDADDCSRGCSVRCAPVRVFRTGHVHRHHR